MNRRRGAKPLRPAGCSEPVTRTETWSRHRRTFVTPVCRQEGGAICQGGKSCNGFHPGPMHGHAPRSRRRGHGGRHFSWNFDTWMIFITLTMSWHPDITSNTRISRDTIEIRAKRTTVGIILMNYIQEECHQYIHILYKYHLLASEQIQDTSHVMGYSLSLLMLWCSNRRWCEKQAVPDTGTRLGPPEHPALEGPPVQHLSSDTHCHCGQLCHYGQPEAICSKQQE
jgi:hypothetical protein